MLGAFKDLSVRVLKGVFAILEIVVVVYIQLYAPYSNDAKA